MMNVQPGAYAGTPSLGVAGALASDPNTAMNVDSAGDRMSVPDRAEYDVNAFTVEFWVRLNSYGDTTQYRSIASKGYSLPVRNWLIGLGNNSNGQLTYGFASGGTGIGRRSVQSLNLNQWYHVAFVHQAATKIQLYINGSLDSEMATTATPTMSSEPIILGDDGQTPSFANARYDEFATYRRALTPTEIQRHYQSGTSPALTCAKVASPTGSDSNVGSTAAPYLTSQKLADSLIAGQTGCLRAGTYVNNRLVMSVANSTLQTFPGDATAKISGALQIEGNGATVQELLLDGTTTGQDDSVLILGSNVTLRHNRITSGNTRICVQPKTTSTSQTANGFLIERNRIYSCGAQTNQDHGIYVSANGGTIRNNAIFDNADRGIQLYPDADNNMIVGNTIDGNGEGILFGGQAASGSDPATASDYNAATRNVISNSRIRWNLEASYPGPDPVGNTANGNCLYASNADPYYNTDGGIDPDSTYAFSSTGTIIGNPLFTNRSGKDFRLGASSPCAGLGAPDDVLAAGGP